MKNNLILLIVVLILSGCAHQGRFVKTGEMVVPREGHSAFLMKDGRVLIMGGEAPRQDGMCCYLSYAVEIYDPNTEKFTRVSDLALPRNVRNWYAWKTLKLQDDRIFIAERTARGHFPLNYIYDPKTGKTIPAKPFLMRRNAFDLVLLPSGEILVIGGGEPLTQDIFPSLGLISQAEIYNPATGKGRLTGSLVFPRSSPTALLLKDGTVLVLGGADSKKESINTVELYNPKTDKFEEIGDMLRESCWSPTILLNGDVLCMTGNAYSTKNSAMIYDFQKRIFRPVGDLNEVRNTPSTVLLSNGHVLIVRGHTIHGYVPHSQTSLEIYDYKKEKFHLLWGLNSDLIGSYTLLKSGKVLFAGASYRSDSSTPRLFEGY